MDPLDPSPPTQFSRDGRTIWSVWYYVTEAVGRFLRPVIDNDGQEPEESNAEINVRVEGAEETQTDPITSSAENNAQSTVTWEECDSNNGIGPAKENIIYTVQFTRGSNEHTLENENEGEIEEQIADTGLLVAKEMATEEEEVGNDGKQHTKVTRTLKTDENEEFDHFGSSNLTHVTLSDNMEESNRSSGLEEIDGIMAHDERQHVDETLRNVQVKDWNEGEKVLIEDKPQDLKNARCSGSEDYAGQLCTSVSPEKDSNIYGENLALARQEEDRGMEHEAAMRKETEIHTSVSEQASTLSDSEDENDLTSDEGSVEHGGAEIQEAVPLCEEILDENSDITASEVDQDAQLQITYNKTAAASDPDPTVGAQVMGETLLKAETENDANLEVTEDGGIAVEREQGIEIAVDDKEKEMTKYNIFDCGFEAKDCAEDDLVTEPITENTEILNRPQYEGGNQDTMAALLQTVTQTTENVDEGEITGNLTHVMLSDDMEETKINSGLEEEIGKLMAHDERQKVHFRNEREEVLTEDETQSLKYVCTVLRSGSEENSGQLYMSMSPEKDSNIYREDMALLRQEEEEGRGMEREAAMRKETERYRSVSEQASTLSDSEDENDLTSDERLVEHGGADVQEAMLLCEEIFDENSDVTASEVAQDTQLQMTYNKRAAASDRDLTIGVQVQMMGERHQKTENNDANHQNATEDGSISVESEQDVGIKAQIDDKEKEITESNIFDIGFEAEVIAGDDMGTEHIEVSEPITENMEIHLNRAQHEGGNQDCVAALLGTVIQTQTTENVALENQSMEPSVMPEHIDHLTVTDGKAQLTEINIPVDEEKTRPDEDKVSSSEEDIVHTKESAFTPIAVKNESHNGGEGTGNLNVTLSDNTEETNRNIGLEEEIGAIMAHDESQNVDIQVKDGNEGEEVLFEDETQSLQDVCTVLHTGLEENSGLLYMSVSPEKDSNIYREDMALLRQEEEEGRGMEREAAMRKETERYTSVSEQASTLSDSEDENDLTSDERSVEHGRADVQEAVLLCEEIFDENSNVTASEVAQDTQLQMTYNKRAAASDRDLTVGVQVQMMGERHQKTENNDANHQNATEDGSISVESEQDVGIKAQIDDKEKEMTESNIFDIGFEAEVIAGDDMGTEHIEVSEPITENMEIHLNRAQHEGGNQDCIAALLGTVTQTQTTENVALENQSMEPSVMPEHIDHLTVTVGKAQLTEINIPVDEEKTRPDEDKVSSSEEDIVHTKDSAFTPIAVKNESHNGGAGTGNLNVMLSDNMEETNRNIGLEEEIGAIMAHDESQNVDIQVKDGNEGEEVLFEDETQSLQDVCTVLYTGLEENSGLLYMSVSPEKDSNIYREDMALLRQEEEEGRGMEHEAAMRKETERYTSVSEQASTLSDSEDENDLTSDKELVEHGGADVQEEVLLCKEIFDENSDVTASEAAQDTQLQMTYNKRAAASDRDLTVGVQVQMMGERLQKTENNDANHQNVTEDGSIAVESEQDVGIKAQIDDKEKEMTESNIFDIGFEAEVIAGDDVGTEHIEVSEPITENMEIHLNRAQHEGGNQDCIAALLGTVTQTQTTENVALENQSMEPSVMPEHIDHLTVTDGKVQLTEINIPVEEKKTRPHEDKVSSSEEDIVHTKESAFTPIAVKNESHNGGEGTENLNVTLSDNMKETNRNIGLEEEIGAIMAHDESQNVDIQLKDGNEGEEVLFEETERYTSVSEQARTLSESEDENDLTSDKELVEHGRADVQEAVLLCEEICDENSDVTASEVAQDIQLQMTYHKRAASSDHDITVGAQVMSETLLKTENKDANYLNTTEDGSIAVEREQYVEIDSQIDDKGKEIIKGIILDCRCEADSSAEDDMGTEHIQVSEPMTEYMEIQLNRAQYEGGNQDAIAALLGTATQTTVAVENQSTELSGIGHLTVTDGKAPLTDLHSPGDEEKTRPEEKVSISEEDVINKNESALTPIAVKTESNNGGEIMGVLRSTSPEISDRLVVVPLKLNSVVCEETQEGVPQYDNNRHELYEDTTQRILEVGEYEEIPTTQLPEEVGSKDLESFIRTVGSGESGHLFIHREEQGSKLESALHIENMFDMVAEGHTGTLCLTDTELPREKEEPSTEPMDGTPVQASAYISTAEFGPVDASLKTGARHSEHVSETDASPQDETQGTDAELSAQTVELLAEMNNEPDIKNGPVLDTQNNTTIEENVDELSEEMMEFPEAQLHKVKVTGFVYEPIDPTDMEENISQTISLAESIVETRMMEQPSATRPILKEEKEVQFMEMDVQDAGLNMQDIAGPGIKKTTAEKETSSEIINLKKMETTATSKTTDGKENALFETDININTEQLLESIEINHEMFNKHCTRMEKAMDVGFYNESLDIKSEPELITSKETEITRHGKATELVRGDVRGMGGPHETDDEILDMWIESVLCKDTDNTEPQMIRNPTKREPEETEDEETGSGPDEEMSKLTEKEPQRVSINKEEPETELALGSETEILETSPLVESGNVVGQFASEWASAENETAIMKLSDADVFQAIHETADSMSEFVISALSVKSSEIEDELMKGADETQDSCVQEDQSTNAIHMQTGFLKNTYVATSVLSEAREDELSYQSQENRETDIDELMGTETGLQVIDPEISDSDLEEKTNWEISKGMEEKSQTKTCALFQCETVNTEDKPFGAIALNISDEMKEVNSGKTYKSQEAESEVLGQRSEPVVVLEVLEGRILTESDLHKKTCLEGQDQLCDVLDALSGRKAASSPVELSIADDTEELATPLPTPGDQLELDFTPQKTRIAIKNPHVRPPKDPRALLHMPSVEPTPPKSSGRLPMKGLTAVSMGGLGIGIKLPGFGAGFPVLKKTNVLREENHTEDCPQKQTETTVEVDDVSPEPVVVLEDQLCDVLEAHSGRKAASSPVELRIADDAEEVATPLPTPGDQLEFNTLDFTPQKTRIAIKNPHARPPKDPRALLQMPSVEPTPSKPSGRLPMKCLAGVPMAGLATGIKLPGFGAGFPVLKKTNVPREENLIEDCPQKETETKLEVNDGSPGQDVAEHKPKWMPPRQPGLPGFGNPLMSELKNRLKKTTKE